MCENSTKVAIEQCLVCHKTIKVFCNDKGTYVAKCPVCNSVMSKRQIRPKKTVIKVVKS